MTSFIIIPRYFHSKTHLILYIYIYYLITNATNVLYSNWSAKDCFPSFNFFFNFAKMAVFLEWGLAISTLHGQKTFKTVFLSRLYDCPVLHHNINSAKFQPLGTHNIQTRRGNSSENNNSWAQEMCLWFFLSARSTDLYKRTNAAVIAKVFSDLKELMVKY